MGLGFRRGLGLSDNGFAIFLTTFWAHALLPVPGFWVMALFQVLEAFVVSSWADPSVAPEPSWGLGGAVVCLLRAALNVLLGRSLGPGALPSTWSWVLCQG